MKATLYKTLSNKKTLIEVRPGQTVRAALNDYNLDNAVILINGKISNPDYEIKKNDIVTVRLTPGATVALIVITAVVAIAAAIYGGIAAYKAKQAAEKAQEELEKVKKLTNKSDIDNRPFLRGASNALATGNSQPYIIGRNFFTPYLLSKPFYQIGGRDGSDEYVYTVLCCGFNYQNIQTVAIDDIKIKTFNDSLPQEGSYKIDDGIFAEDGKIEVRQRGWQFEELTALNYKTESNTRNDEIPHDIDVTTGKSEPLTYTLNQYAKDVDIAITFPYGLYATNDSGDKIKTKTTILAQYSLDGGKIWYDFTFNRNGTPTNTFEYKEPSKELRFVAHKDFTKEDYTAMKNNGADAVYIRVRNTGNKDSMIHNDCYVLYYQSVCFDPDKSDEQLVPCKIVEDRERNFCTIIGLKLKASKINEDKLKKINIVTHGRARTWNGTQWSTEKTATRNPAAWVLEIETSRSHPASRRSDSELDLESLGEYYEYCEANGYKFDWTVTQNTKKDTVLNYIMEATGACIYYDIYGRRAVAVDRPQENALAVYNPQNIINIQNKKAFGRKTDGLRIKYINSNNDLYQEDTYIVMREGRKLGQDSIIKDITVTGITTFSHIVKYARRLMAIEELRPKTTIIEVGNEGVFYTPFSKVLIQDDSLKIGIGRGYIIRGCEWRSGLLKKIHTNEPLTFDPEKTYGIIVNCFTADGGNTAAVKVKGTGTTTELTVISQIRISADVKPEEGNIFSFGELDINGEFSKVTTEYIISQIKRSEKGFCLELVNYNNAIYESGSIPAYKSNITQKKTAEKKTIPIDAVTHDQLMDTVATIDGTKAAREAASLITDGVRYSSVHRLDDTTLSLTELLSMIDGDRREVSDGITVTEERITLKVEDTEKNLRSFIDITKGQILAAVEDGDAKQASALRLTKEEIMLGVNNMNKETLARLSVQAAAVQALVQGGGASGRLSLSLELPAMLDSGARQKFISAAGGTAAVDAVYAKLKDTDYWAIRGDASQTTLKKLWNYAVKSRLLASQLELNANQIVVKNGNATAAAFVNGKLKADYIDVDTLAARIMEISNLTVKSTLTLGDGTTNGIIKSNNYTSGGAGFKIDGNTGNAEFNDANINGFLRSNNTPFQPIAMLNLGYNHNTIQLYNNKNVASVSRDATGVYTVTLSKPVRLKTHTYGDYQYIDVFALGNAHDTFDNGFQNVIIPTINWVRNYVNGRLTVVDGYATVSYFVLYFDDNNTDSYQDPRSAQIFIFGTETD